MWVHNATMNPPWREHNWLLKGMGDEPLIGFLHVTVCPKHTHYSLRE